MSRPVYQVLIDCESEQAQLEMIQMLQARNIKCRRRGMFDIPPRQREDLSWEVDLPIEEQANRFPDLPWLKQPVAAS